MKAITKIIIILAVGVTVSFLLYLLVVAPLLTEVNIINADVRNKKAELATLQQQIRAFKTAQSDLAKAIRKDEIINVIPAKEDLVSAVLEVERAAEATSSIHLLRLSEPADPKDKKAPIVIAKKSGIEEVPYELSVTNDFTGMVNFLAYLEHLPHFTELSKLQFNSERIAGSDSDTLGRSGVVNGEFKGVFFIKSK